MIFWLSKHFSVGGLISFSFIHNLAIYLHINFVFLLCASDHIDKNKFCWQSEKRFQSLLYSLKLEIQFSISDTPHSTYWDKFWHKCWIKEQKYYWTFLPRSEHYVLLDNWKCFLVLFYSSLCVYRKYMTGNTMGGDFN